MRRQCEKSTRGRSGINREIRYETTWDTTGVLADWYGRALRRAAKRCRALLWSDFELTAINGTDRSRMQREAEFSAEYLKLRGGSVLDCAPSDLPPPPPLPFWEETPPVEKGRRSASLKKHSRKAVRHQVK